MKFFSKKKKVHPEPPTHKPKRRSTIAKHPGPDKSPAERKKEYLTRNKSQRWRIKNNSKVVNYLKDLQK